MCLLDTTDGALMMTLYTSTALAHDQIAILYYSIVLTVITVVVAVVIGVIQLLNLVLNVAAPEGKFWDGVQAVGDHYDIVGKLLTYFRTNSNLHLRNSSFPSRLVYVVGYALLCSNIDARFTISFSIAHFHPHAYSTTWLSSVSSMCLNRTSSGGAICGSFIVFGALSVLLYRPWRRRIDRRRSQAHLTSSVSRSPSAEDEEDMQRENHENIVTEDLFSERGRQTSMAGPI